MSLKTNELYSFGKKNVSFYYSFSFFYFVSVVTNIRSSECFLSPVDFEVCKLDCIQKNFVLHQRRSLKEFHSFTAKTY